MKNIYLSETDHKKLTKFVHEYSRAGKEFSATASNLAKELSRAIVMSDHDLPLLAVSLNSTVVLKDMATGETEEWTVTTPEYADSEKKRISVLSPIGIGVIGFMEKDEIEWETPGGTRLLRIESVKQGAFKNSSLTQALYGL